MTIAALFSILLYICILGLIYYVITKAIPLAPPILLIVQVIFGLLILVMLIQMFTGHAVVPVLIR